MHRGYLHQPRVVQLQLTQPLSSLEAAEPRFNSDADIDASDNWSSSDDAERNSREFQLDKGSMTKAATKVDTPCMKIISISEMPLPMLLPCDLARGCLDSDYGSRV